MTWLATRFPTAARARRRMPHRRPSSLRQARHPPPYGRPPRVVVRWFIATHPGEQSEVPAEIACKRWHWGAFFFPILWLKRHNMTAQAGMISAALFVPRVLHNYTPAPFGGLLIAAALLAYWAVRIYFAGAGTNSPGATAISRRVCRSTLKCSRHGCSGASACSRWTLGFRFLFWGHSWQRPIPCPPAGIQTSRVQPSCLYWRRLQPPLFCRSAVIWHQPGS